jgi:hypothetical protein
VVAAQRHAGYPFDRKRPEIEEREAKPILADDLKDLLRGLRANIPADARDGALLALGWGAAASFRARRARLDETRGRYGLRPH